MGTGSLRCSLKTDMKYKFTMTIINVFWQRVGYNSDGIFGLFTNWSEPRTYGLTVTYERQATQKLALGTGVSMDSPVPFLLEPY